MRPLQTAPKTDQWYEDNVRYWARTLAEPYIDSQRYRELQKTVAGVMDFTNYRYITDMYGINRRNNMPAKLRNFDFISPIFMKWLAEWRMRGFDPVILAQDSDYVNKVEQFQRESYIQSLQQVFVNTLIKQGKFIEGEVDENGQPKTPPPHPETIAMQARSLKDEKSIEGQKLLGHMMKEVDFINTASVMWFDFITGLASFTFRGVRNDKPFFERVEPDRIAFSLGDNNRFVEKAEAVRYVNAYTFAEIIDRFSEFEDFTDEIINDLESRNLRTGTSHSSLSGFWRSLHREREGREIMKDYSVDTIMVEHFQWTALKKIQRVKIKNIFGEEKTIDYDDTYVAGEDEEVEARWVNCEYEAYRIDERYTIGKKESDYQRATYDNPNDTRKYYNGLVFMSHFPYTMPPAKKLEAYQEQVNVLKYVMQSTINKNKDKLAVIPLGLFNGMRGTDSTIEPKEDVRVDLGEYPDDNLPNIHDQQVNEDPITQALYYADATQMLFVDETSPTAQIAVNLLKTLDLSMGNSVQIMMNLITEIKQEASDLIGFNRFRQAQIKASDSVGNVQQGQQQAELTTEEYFIQFNELLEKEAEALLDLSNYCYRTGVTSNFVRTDGEIERFKIEPNHLNYREYGAFIVSDGRTKMAVQQMMQLAQAYMQNEGKLSAVGKMLNANNNLSKIVSLLEQVEGEAAQRQQAQSQAEQQNAMQIAQLDYQKHSDNVNIKLYEINKKAEIEMNKLIAQVEQAGGGKELESLLKAREYMLKETQAIQDAILKNEELKIKSQDVATKKYVADINFKIAKENKGV